MLAVLIWMLHAGSLSAQADPSEGWLPIPDGYVWPLEVKGAKAFKPEQRAVAVLPVPAKGMFEGEPASTEVQVFEVDLNADGKEELFVEIPILHGTAGTFYEILSPTKSGDYRSVGSLQGWGIRFRAAKNGWLQIEAASRAGGGQYTRYLLTFQDRVYLESRNEDHNFNRHKVTVRHVGNRAVGKDGR
jgi:hypothetical protein